MTTQVHERHGAVTFKGEKKTLVGPELRAGDPLPDFTVAAADLRPVTPRDITAGGTRAALLIVVPSLDTGVCALESKTFGARLNELPEGIAAYVVSRDMPFAQKRWKEAEGSKLEMLSDYKDHSFGRSTGLEIKELGFLARAVIVVGGDNVVRYLQLVPEVAQEPNYDEAIAAARGA